MALEMTENARRKTSAWNKTAVLPVRPSLNETLVPFVLRIIPGLRAKKRDAGIIIFCDVISGSMFVYIFITLFISYRIVNYRMQIQRNRHMTQILK